MGTPSLDPVILFRWSENLLRALDTSQVMASEIDKRLIEFPCEDP